jgi:hypothetical protein
MSESTQYRLAEVWHNGIRFTAHADIYQDGVVINQWTECFQENPCGDDYRDAYQGDKRWSVVESHTSNIDPQAVILCKLITEADKQLKHFINELTK